MIDTAYDRKRGYEPGWSQFLRKCEEAQQVQINVRNRFIRQFGQAFPSAQEDDEDKKAPECHSPSGPKGGHRESDTPTKNEQGVLVRHVSQSVQDTAISHVTEDNDPSSDDGWTFV